jgi:hypothetical protein
VAQETVNQVKPSGNVLKGIVTDANGMVIRNATIEAINLETSAAKNAESNKNGEFSIEGLMPGEYTIRVTDTGTRAFITVIVVDLRESIVGLNLSARQSVSSISMPGTRCTRLTRGDVPRASMSKALRRGVKALTKPFGRGKTKK